ncbi:hypothetical protein EMIHUDRAFT_214690 [Emiliania huxleyi CCMP1516]|uniref:Xrn1 helical domain-containing protein n=2 Tax=Emiliania huxleyi TaxID=2903 RepID=A0A0D3IJB9_EMIH1|nr:hypothetical protein EMIHUDRAFT_214690 [Emiliania huxleyi CCMP1516]EOD11354.1 hypothetical protein EMIHUDRAFT_214690 [Emiliania huxleyi CCMP1516]|eukprot:XP_005763783.1 hypothetical protein EMIHUDRAFT_214690 [Emiliania huxleyi CCMP1516]
MGVLPPRSAHALPEPLAQLMTDPGFEIADFYPEDFALDLNGKKRGSSTPWESACASSPRTSAGRNSVGEPVLFLSDAHPLCAPLVGSYGPPPAPLVLTSCTEHSASVAGTLTPLPGAPLPGGLCEPPPFRGIEVALRPFTTSAAGTTFTLPPPAKHVPQLLPGLVPPSPLLGACDAPCESKRYLLAGGVEVDDRTKTWCVRDARLAAGPGGSSDANRSAADLLRQQLMRR